MTDVDTAAVDAAAHPATDAFTALLADLPAKARIHEVAKRFGVSSRLLIDALDEGGVTVKSSSSSVDATAARTALSALRDSGRLVVGPAVDAATSVDAVEAVVTDALAVADAVEDAPVEAAPEPPATPAPAVEPAPWAPLFTEPPAVVAVTDPAPSDKPAKPSRRRASRPAAAPDVTTAVVTTAVITPTASTPTAPAAPASVETATGASPVETDEEQYADLPARMRVHELAKRAGISAKTLIALLTEQGVVAKSANSVLARTVAVDLLRSMSAPGSSSEPGEQPALVTEEEAEAGSGAAGDADGDGHRGRRRRGRRGRNRAGDPTQDTDDTDADDSVDAAGGSPAGPATVSAGVSDDSDIDDEDDDDDDDAEDGAGQADRGDGAPSRSGRRRRRRGGRGPDRAAPAASGDDTDVAGSVPAASTTADSPETDDDDAEGGEADDTGSTSSRRRRRRRRGGSDDAGRPDDPTDTVVHVRDSGQARSAESEVQGVRGSTRLEAKRQRRRDSLQTRRRPQILTEAEFLARRESVHRVMAVRQRGDLTQVAVLEDNVLVEHFVSRAGSASMIGNVHLGRVQNVLPSMEAAFVDIGKGRNAVLYAGEVNWEAAGLAGKSRRIESALSSGDTVLVQVSKDPVGHKGARLTTQISLPGRFLVYVPAGGATGISRKLPDTERKRLKAILDRIVPDDAGVIIRTAAEGVSEEELARDVERLKAQWEQIQAAAAQQTQGAQPKQLYSEPDTLIKVIRDLFNSDISELIIDGDDSEHGIWDSLSSYVEAVAPELAPRVHRFDGATDVFAAHRIDEQIAKALERKVFLPSGGSLVIDRTEAMTVVDVNTGKYTGSGGNLEETVTKNNLEAAEEVVRQLRLRDIGGIIVVDFIDMVLESNRELVLRRLTECLGRDRTRHQVAEVTSLGLVQMTRKKMGTGLVEAFSEPCAHCHGRGIVLRDVPIDPTATELAEAPSTDRSSGRRGRGGRGRDTVAEIEPVVPVVATPRRDPRGPKPPEFGAGAGAGTGTGAARPADEDPTNGLSSSLLAELNGLSGSPATPADGSAPVDGAAPVDGYPDDGAGPVDPAVLAALLPAPDELDADEVGAPEVASDEDGTETRDNGAPRRRRRGGRGRSRRDRAVDESPESAGVHDTDPDDSDEPDPVDDTAPVDDAEGVSADDAVLADFDEPSTADTGAQDVESDQLDLLPSLDAAEPVVDPADAISDTTVMDPSFGADVVDGDVSADDPDDTDTVEEPATEDTAAGDAPEPAAETVDPVVVEAPVAAARPRRRRAASRPAGPPQGAGLL